MILQKQNCILSFFSHKFLFFLPKFVIYIFKSFDNKISLFLKDLNSLHFVVNFLKKSSFFKFEQLIDYTAIHNLNLKSFTLVLEMLSITFCNRLFIKYKIFEYHSAISITSFFDSAGWSEREIYDMFGIFFHNHKDLRRILTDYGFLGYPLRKDFPLIGYNEIRYSEISKTIISSSTQYKNKVK